MRLTVIPRNRLATLTRNCRRSMHCRDRPPNPLVLVLGATGTGKSDLAIQLARSFEQRGSPGSQHGVAGAEIVNADAMQLYRGLPVITNKVGDEDQLGIRHHLLDHIGLEEEPWTVQEYVKEADRVICDVQSRGKLPIVVGGTNYYVHGLLFADAVLEGKESGERATTEEKTAEHGKDAAQAWRILAASTPEIYAKLQEVDPHMAKRWHPNDRRKIQRSLEIYLRSGQKASDVYRDQKDSERDGEGTNRLRYDPIIFWLAAEDQALKDRLDRRVDTMVGKGLLDEARVMHDFMQKIQRGASLDKSRGIWVSIGYKETEPWVEAVSRQDLQYRDLEKLKTACIEAVKAGTRQYAKRQNRYIRIRLANALTGAGIIDNLFLLDCTDLASWEKNVQQPALRILQSFLQGEELPNPPDLSPLASDTLASMANASTSPNRAARRCETCDKVLMTEEEWIKHVNSRSHKKVLQGIRKRELNEARMREAVLSQDEVPG